MFRREADEESAGDGGIFLARRVNFQNENFTNEGEE
jgi:hypothetical protein